VYFTNYELQVKSLIDGVVDIAWNSPLAWLDSQRRSGGSCRAIAMRDTDRDRRSHLITRVDSGIATVAELEGRTIAFGAADSPQALLIPREHLRRAGLAAGRYIVRRFDVLVGKHGDHIGGELDAFRALDAGEVAASCLLDLNWDTWTKDGTIDTTRYRILSTTDLFDHCVFTVTGSFAAEREQAFLDALFAMDYGNPQHKEMMDLEGLKKWEPGRTTGFELLGASCEHLGFFEGA
ncbi:MAG: PhnD/SsuA/transferrin family substrate-binding protein, partial [Planctomycetes bacterium]|nr:PhnD/SsuA/transferrin family substrate-binding protein [Planctomycetota bacterium]